MTALLPTVDSDSALLIPTFPVITEFLPAVVFFVFPTRTELSLPSFVTVGAFFPSPLTATVLFPAHALPVTDSTVPAARKAAMIFLFKAELHFPFRFAISETTM